MIATGLANQEHRPAPFLGLPRELVSHSCEHEDFARFAGKRVAVVGAGQSGCESAALLSEVGADVDLFSREPIRWIGSEGSAENAAAPVKDLLRSLTRTKNGVGPFPLNYLADRPNVVRTPAGRPSRRVHGALSAAGGRRLGQAAAQQRDLS